MTSMNVPIRLTAASLAAVFALTACSSSGVFDFTETPMGPAESIEFRIPDELLESNKAYVENSVFESITLSSAEIEGSSRCAVEYQFEYVEGGFERFEKYLEYADSYNESKESTVASRFLDTSVEAMEINEDYTTAVRPVNCAASPSDAESTVPVLFVRTINSDGRERVLDFARSEVSVMQGGDLFVHEVEVEGWRSDSNGNWIKD